MMKKYLSVVLFLFLFLALGALSPCTLAGEAGSVHADAKSTIELGEVFPDFTVQTTEGTFSLSEELKDHEAVLLVFWASWCPPCYEEFPYIQKMADALKDQVRVIALSIEDSDSMEVIADYGKELGLTIPLGRDEDNLYAYTPQEGYPTPVLIDRFGRVSYMKAGSLPSEEAAFTLVSAVLGDPYEETRTFTDFPTAKSKVAYASSDELTEALTGGGSPLTFQNDPDGFAWPWLPLEEEGLMAAQASNSEVPSSEALVLISFTAEEGDVLAFDFKLSANPLDYLLIKEKGRTLATYAGVRDWSTAVIPLEKGEREISLIFQRYMDLGLFAVEEESALISNVRLVSGKEAEELKGNLPSYPVSDQTDLEVFSEGGGRLKLYYEDPVSGESVDLLDEYGLSLRVLGGDFGSAVISLDESIDPEAEVLICMAGEEITAFSALSDLLNEDGSAFETSLKIRDEEDGNYVLLLGPDFLTDDTLYEFDLFSSEEKARALLDQDFLEAVGMKERDVRFVFEGGEGQLEMEPGPETETGQSSETETEPSPEDGEALYRITVADQDGNPVSGAIVNICTDTACTLLESDEKGQILYQGEKQSYHLQVLKVPDGYIFDAAQELYTEDQTDFTISLTRD